MTSDNKVLMKKFLAIAGESPEDIKEELLLLREKVRTPESFTDDTHPDALNKFRRNARQSIRRIMERHPDIAARVMQEAE
jgi:hypothetical protein